MLLLSLFTFFALSLDSPLQAKTVEAVSLQVHLDGVPEYGGAWELIITLQAREDLKKAEIWVENSDGLSLRRGSPFWYKKKIKSGKRAVIRLSFSLIGSLPQDVTINLVGHTSSGKRFEQKIRRNIEFTSGRL